MNVFITVLGAVLLVAGIALLCIRSIPKNAGISVLVAALVLTLAGSCFTIVPTGYTGVKTTFGQVSEQTAGHGFNWKIPFVQSIKMVNNKQQDTTVEEQIWGETAEKTPVYASDTIITYQILSERSSWIYANVSDPDKNLITPSLVSSAVKSATVQLGSQDVTNRSKIEPLVKDQLNASLAEKYGENTVYVLKVVVNNMDFEASYNEAIAQKSLAQKKYEQQQVENQTAIEKAEADNKVAIAKAEADKQVIIAQAEAQAQATLIKAQAEADANKLIAASLTEALVKSRFYETWDGKLPTVMGENTVITDVATAN